MVPMFAKHVDTYEEMKEFETQHSTFIHNIVCEPVGFCLVYSLPNCGTYANLPSGHELYEEYLIRQSGMAEEPEIYTRKSKEVMA